MESFSIQSQSAVNLTTFVAPPPEMNSDSVNSADTSINLPQQFSPEPSMPINELTSGPSEDIESASSELRFYFSCKFCDKYYVAREAIRRHIKDKHKFDNVTVDHYSPCFKLPAPSPRKKMSVTPLVESDSPHSSSTLERVHYSCTFCDKYYTTMANVKKHIKKVHLFDHVEDGHYTASMMQPKTNRVKPIGDVTLKHKGFVTPRRVTGSAGMASDPGEFGGMGHLGKLTVGGEVQPSHGEVQPSLGVVQPLAGGVVQPLAGGVVRIPVAGPGQINLPAASSPHGVSLVCAPSVSVQEFQFDRVQLPKAGRVETRKKGKSRKRKPQKTSKTGYFKDLENMIMDPTKNEKFQLWKKGTSQSPTSDLLAPPKRITQAEIVTPSEVTQPKNVTPTGIVTQMESMPSPESCPEQGRLPVPTTESMLLPNSMATSNTTPSFSKSFESSVESSMLKQTMKRGRRSTVPSAKKGRGRLKCGLSACVPCSFEMVCGRCPQCLNKTMK